MSAEIPLSRQPLWLRTLLVLTLACVIAGVMARFHGLGRWPLAIDEYYFAQSVQNLLHFGIPKFPCGGLYVRGLLLQYASAALQLTGLSAELAPRLLAAVSSLLTLPAAYLIGRRLGGRATGLIIVAVLSLSVWEIEIGRFGRMYAPFQAIFVWYVVCFLSYTIDRNRRALLPMLLLSALGLGVWEGGIFLVVTNLLPPFIWHPDGRLAWRDWVYIGACSLLLIPAYFLTIADLRTAWSPPVYPPDYVEPPDEPSQSRLDAAVMPLAALRAHTAWLIAALLPAALSLAGILRYLRIQTSPLARLSVVLLIGCVALQQFGLALGLAIALTLLSVVELDELTGPAARWLQAAVLAWVAFWVAFGLTHDDWHVQGLSAVKAVFLLVYEFVRFPDLVRQVAMPWARTVPLLSIGLFVLTSGCIAHACIARNSTPQAERVLLAVFVILMLAAAASDPPRHETRYVFFLYPLAVGFCVLTVGRTLRAVPALRVVAPATAAAVSLALFALSEDFRPIHLWNIDTAEVNFRIGMSGRLAGHYHPRSNVRAAADWLKAHVAPAEDIVVISFPGVDFYYPRSDFYFVAESDPRFDVWTCGRGTVQRWSNLPMIYSYETLAAKVATRRKVWMVVEMSRMPDIVAKFQPGQWHLTWTSRAGDIGILAFQVPAASG